MDEGGAERPPPRRARSLARLALPVGLSAIAVAASVAHAGWSGTAAAAIGAGPQLGTLAVRVGAALLLAAVIQVWLPRERMRRLLGSGRGILPLFLAGLVGSVTVGGPMTSFPILAALAAAQVEAGALVAFLTGWSLLAVQRIIVWEWPLLGPEFVLVRLAASFALPVVAGLIMRALVRRAAGGPA